MVRYMAHPEPLDRMHCEQRGKFPRIEVIGVIRRALIVGHRTLPWSQIEIADMRLRGHRRRERQVGRPRLPGAKQLGGRCGGRRRERVQITVALGAGHPAVEPRSLFERSVAGGEEFGLADPDCRQRRAHRRPGPLADADGRDVGRLDQCDVKLRGARRAGKEARREPAGGAAAHDDNPLDRAIHCRRS